MGLTEKMMEDVVVAMKKGDKGRVNALRYLLSQLKYAKIASQQSLTPEQETDVLLTATKKHKEAIDIYLKSGKEAQAAKEQQELDIISHYLPKQMTEEEVENAISEFIAQTGATSLKDIGKVMGIAMRELKGKADGKMVQEIVKRKLA
ncbi:GatB/YqeY domain-containing protein [candidate division KSB1 bacterium]|nr:GatB/YqeY domain-containing protein [candidate division KSB1 bacterium]